MKPTNEHKPGSARGQGRGIFKSKLGSLPLQPDIGVSARVSTPNIAVLHAFIPNVVQTFHANEGSHLSQSQDFCWDIAATRAHSLYSFPNFSVCPREMKR